MYELIIVSLLMRRSLHGYRIAKIINNLIGPWAKVSHGRLYPLLAKLEQDGLIAEAPEDGEAPQSDRQQRKFTITDTGRQRFRQLMLDTASNPGEYQKFFRLKVMHLELLAPAERLYLLDHYINYCRAFLLHTKTVVDDLIQRNAAKQFMSPAFLEAVIDIKQRIAQQWQAELEWTQRLRGKEAARIEGEEGVPPRSRPTLDSAPALNGRERSQC